MRLATKINDARVKINAWFIFFVRLKKIVKFSFQNKKMS